MCADARRAHCAIRRASMAFAARHCAVCSRTSAGSAAFAAARQTRTTQGPQRDVLQCSACCSRSLGEQQARVQMPEYWEPSKFTCNSTRGAECLRPVWPIGATGAGFPDIPGGDRARHPHVQVRQDKPSAGLSVQRAAAGPARVRPCCLFPWLKRHLLLRVQAC